MAECHVRQCKYDLGIGKFVQRGHVVKTKFKSQNEERPHVISWSSSPYLLSDELLVNSRVNHGLACSGILPADYVRFSKEAGIRCISKDKRNIFFSDHKNHIQAECEESISTAPLEEIVHYEATI